jgi:hypothetical protein
MRVSNFLLWQISYSELLRRARVLAGVPQDAARGSAARVRRPQRKFGGLIADAPPQRPATAPARQAPMNDAVRASADESGARAPTNAGADAPMSASADAPKAPSKAKKILRRTLSGGALVTAVAAILWWNHHSGSGRPILYVAAVGPARRGVGARRMGSFAQRDLLPALPRGRGGRPRAPRGRHRGHEWAASLSPSVPRDILSIYRPNLLHEMAWAGALALVAFCLQRDMRRLLPSPAVSRTIAYIAVGFIVFVAVRDTAEVAARLRPAWMTIGVLGLFSLLPVLVRRVDARSLALVVALAIWVVPPIPALWHLWIAWGTKA